MCELERDKPGESQLSRMSYMYETDNATSVDDQRIPATFTVPPSMVRQLVPQYRNPNIDQTRDGGQTNMPIDSDVQRNENSGPAFNSSNKDLIQIASENARNERRYSTQEQNGLSKGQIPPIPNRYRSTSNPQSPETDNLSTDSQTNLLQVPGCGQQPPVYNGTNRQIASKNGATVYEVVV